MRVEGRPYKATLAFDTARSRKLSSIIRARRTGRYIFMLCLPSAVRPSGQYPVLTMVATV